MTQHKESTKKAPGKPFKKGDERAGRPKGTPNKFTTLKHSFLNVYEEMGGDTGFAEWAKKERNKALFYKMLSQMLPKNVTIHPSEYAEQFIKRVMDKHPDIVPKLEDVMREMEE